MHMRRTDRYVTVTRPLRDRYATVSRYGMRLPVYKLFVNSLVFINSCLCLFILAEFVNTSHWPGLADWRCQATPGCQLLGPSCPARSSRFGLHCTVHVLDVWLVGPAKRRRLRSWTALLDRAAPQEGYWNIIRWATPTSLSSLARSLTQRSALQKNAPNAIQAEHPH